MKNNKKNFIIKLPSSANVNVTSLWGVLKTISNTGKVFLEDHLIKTGSPVNEKNLFRFLAYLKYLGLIYERREKENVGDKEVNVQRWYQKDNSKVVDFFYMMKAGREEEAKKVFADILSSHDLFCGIKEELLPKNPSPTGVDLEYYFKNKTPGKSPSYYQHGVKFVTNLLFFVKLLKKDGNSFTFIFEDKKPETSEEDKEQEKGGDDFKKENLKLEKNKYLVRIFGEGADLSFALNNPSDIEDVEALLNIIKKKLI